MLFGVGTSFAWQNYDFATRTTTCSNMLEDKIIADNGDVVTTDKWNKAVCATWNIWEAVADW